MSARKCPGLVSTGDNLTLKFVWFDRPDYLRRQLHLVVPLCLGVVLQLIFSSRTVVERAPVLLSLDLGEVRLANSFSQAESQLRGGSPVDLCKGCNVDVGCRLFPLFVLGCCVV